MALYTNNLNMKQEYQILTKFRKESYEKIVREAHKRGLPKSSLVRMITLKVLADECI